jgi:hypothetical protein
LVSISGYTPPATPTLTSIPTFTGAPGQNSSPKAVTININKGNVTAKEIANAVNKGAKTTGAPSITPAALRKLGAN